MTDPDRSDDAPALVSNRSMDIVVAVVLLAGSGLVMFDSVRVGHGWLEGQGPGPGFFPFYVALILALASLVNLVRAALKVERGGDGAFVSTTAIRRVLTVFVPTLAYVALIPFIGIYVSSAVFIAGFMILLGSQSILKSLAVGGLVPAALFLMFEIWFKVPLPKGPLEALIGY